MSVEDEKLNEEFDGQDTTSESVEAGAETEVDTGVEQDGKDWQKEAEGLTEQMTSLKDQALRAQAEMQNIRRRAEMDVEKAHKFALEKFAKELLPVIDSLENALEAENNSGNESTTLKEGVEMTLSMFLGGISKFSLEQINPVGSTFDPALHEAMSMVEAPDAEPNTVIAAMQKGYTLSGRLIRPAMVVVAKGSAKIDEKA